MALSSGSRELGRGGRALRAAGVSTGPSLQWCALPSALGSAVATAALEQLLAVGEQPAGAGMAGASPVAPGGHWGGPSLSPGNRGGPDSG